MSQVTPPPLQVPTAKERKYDRQLRLWAATGQTALENANVLLINAGAGVSGVEALKNLVLPGIGQFSILDSNIVSEADLGVNFFLEEEDLGKPRAEGCARLLQELNPDVQGYTITEPLESFITRPEALVPFTFILVALPLAPEIISRISSHASDRQIPVFYFHCLGFYSHFTVQLPQAFPIVDTHPDPTATQDLRLLEPWPELFELVKDKAAGIETMDEETHGHVPWVIILLHYLRVWCSEHDGKAPQNYKEKTAFRDKVRNAMRTDSAEGSEENFEEAIGAVLKSLNPHSPSGSVKEVLLAEECIKLTAESADFWLIANGVKDFYDKHGALPLSGSLPDMKAKSADYIELQNIYKTKAREDVAQVLQSVRLLEERLGRASSIETRDVEAFCKRAGSIKLIRGQTTAVSRGDAQVNWGHRAKFATNSLSMPDSLMPIYLAFLAYDRFMTGTGATDTDLDARDAKITSVAHFLMDELIEQAGATVEEPDYSNIREGVAQTVQELVRADGGEMHNVAAVTGGMLAQEAIKVITKQYVPVDNTCIFDGVLSKTSVLRL